MLVLHVHNTSDTPVATVHGWLLFKVQSVVTYIAYNIDIHVTHNLMHALTHTYLHSHHFPNVLLHMVAYSQVITIMV